MMWLQLRPKQILHRALKPDGLQSCPESGKKKKKRISSVFSSLFQSLIGHRPGESFSVVEGLSQ